MKFLKKIIFSKNVWTIGIAIFVVWLAFSSMGAFLYPSHSNEIFLYNLEVVLISFLGASLIIKIISKIINSNFLFKYLDINPTWLFVLALGSLFFCLLFRYPRFFAFEVFVGVFLLGFVPAVLFRISLTFIVFLLSGSKESAISIINE